LTASSPFPPELRAIIDREREIPPVPAGQRARALARASATLAAPPTAVVRSRATSRPRWIPAAAALAASAALAAGAYELHVNIGAARPVVAGTSAAVTTPEKSPRLSAPAEIPEAPRQPAPPALAESPELHLIRQAHAAVARGDFAAALRPIAEHARRYKDGRMAEEREALRVKVLAALGHTEEARRAAASFRARFPRSVLVPAISRMPAGG